MPDELFPMKGLPMQCSINVLALVKESERYIFLYDDESPTELLQTLGQYAADPNLSFTWYDAAVLSQKVRRLNRQQSSDSSSPRLFDAT